MEPESFRLNALELHATTIHSTAGTRQAAFFLVENF